MIDTSMTSNIKTEHSRQAVLVFLDDQPAVGQAPQSLLSLLLRHLARDPT
jgi:hypothetical protein